MTARRLLLPALVVPTLALGAVAALNGENSPWAPAKLDIGFDLGSVQVNAPAPPVVATPQPAIPTPVGPPTAPNATQGGNGA